MAEKTEGRVEFKDFPGLMSAMDDHDVPPGGAVIQVNVGATIDAQLVVRGGYREVIFDA